MRRTLVIVIAVIAAAVLVFAVAANLFPDWTWKVLHTVRSTEARILGKGHRQLELSKYAPTRRHGASRAGVMSIAATEFALHNCGTYTE
jgi:hypothetical protein